MLQLLLRAFRVPSLSIHWQGPGPAKTWTSITHPVIKLYLETKPLSRLLGQALTKAVLEREDEWEGAVGRSLLKAPCVRSGGSSKWYWRWMSAWRLADSFYRGRAWPLQDPPVECMIPFIDDTGGFIEERKGRYSRWQQGDAGKVRPLGTQECADPQSTGTAAPNHHRT